MSQGAQINSLSELILLAQNRQSIICPESTAWNKPVPAAFAQNLQARIVHRMIEMGMFVYIPKT